jgi:hypothetical protein
VADIEALAGIRQPWNRPDAKIGADIPAFHRRLCLKERRFNVRGGSGSCSSLVVEFARDAQGQPHEYK